MPIRILLVDDNPFFLDAARDFLHLHQTLELVGTATNGRSALEQAQELQPDVILLDLNLGQESAIQLIPTMREYLPDMRIVIVTSMEEGYREFVLQNGADAFVRKPSMTQILVSTIADLYETPETSRNSKR